MPEKRDENEQQRIDAETGAKATGDTTGAEDALDDLADLDLTVETVEERISPSETNVFDK